MQAALGERFPAVPAVEALEGAVDGREEKRLRIVLRNEQIVDLEKIR